jgi:probable addiction module antidote protein
MAGAVQRLAGLGLKVKGKQVPEKIRMPGARAFNAAKYRNDPGAIAEYLNEALSTEDSFVITMAIRNMVRAQGMIRFSRKAGFRRDSLDKTFKAEVSPAFDTILKLIVALDIRLMAKPVANQ